MRIIAGQKKGRTLIAPKGDDTRPTLERVKEAVFGMIQFDLYGRRVLDLFAGSGALGLEALSRGANSCVFCDISRLAAAVIRHNITKLGFENEATVLEMDYEAAIRRLSMEKSSFDIVFIDPPYAKGLYDSAMAALVNNNVLNGGYIIAVEHDKMQAITPPQGASVKTKHYGDVRITLIRGE